MPKDMPKHRPQSVEVVVLLLTVLLILGSSIGRRTTKSTPRSRKTARTETTARTKKYYRIFWTAHHHAITKLE